MTWSDGYSSSFGLNCVSALALCPLCGGVFWYDDANEIGLCPREPKSMSWLSSTYAKLTGDKNGRLAEQNRWLATPLVWKGAPYCGLPRFPEFLAALKDTAQLTPLREAIVRRAIWWRGSDHLRCKTDGTRWSTAPALSESKSQENLLGLLDLHGGQIADAPLEKAEIFRQLGRFEEAIALLKSICADDHKFQTAGKIMQFAQRGETEVREVWRSQ